MCSTKVIKIKGRVQGVGFRPFVFSLAMQYKLCGFVQNNMDGVYIVVQGTEENIIYPSCSNAETTFGKNLCA